MSEYTHQKIVFNATVWQPFFFTDLYRFGEEAASTAPLVYYIGGAGDSKRFEDRVNTEPEVLLNEFSKALESCATKDVTLLVSPAPLTMPEQRETRLDDFLSFFLSTLIPKVLNDLPDSIAFVGSAYGSFFATYFAFKLRQCRALALVSGMGMIEACEKCGDTLRKNLAIDCYSNIDDEIGSWADEFAIYMNERGVKVPVHRRQGNRQFDDYRDNGSVRDAFMFALENLR